MFWVQFFSRHASVQKILAISSVTRRTSKSVKHGRSVCLRSIFFNSVKYYPTKLVLGIETSCDDTAAAVVDDTGKILGEALHSQNEVHLKTGGIIPPVAQQLHRENIERIVKETLYVSGISLDELSAVATTVKPGLALSLRVGLEYSLKLVDKYKKPFIPIHHMEAHALTIRLINQVEFPFLVLLISGGHCILVVAQGVSDFLLLGQSVDIAPGDMLDKVARRLSLTKHPECCRMSGGKAIEHLAQQGNRLHYELRAPMRHHRNCNFSFSGLCFNATRIIMQKEKEEGIFQSKIHTNCTPDLRLYLQKPLLLTISAGLREGHLLSCVTDIAAAVQHAVALHIVQRTHRAILFCIKSGILSQTNATLVVSGGVASNQYIRRALQIVTDETNFNLLCPPSRLCTDNGVMIAWNGIERMRAGLGVLHSTDGIRYEPKASLGIDISEQVGEVAIKVPSLEVSQNELATINL
ncbi:tRNA N6-adenosine threonylcarbamoyltransferase, mitochondrial isoform X1 [Malaclemys terrapin pileata]|uniref:tRNA N6-adenosine threonylcarbamoyltransferase, mitochondrial isoform X1 n=1 Tax=Malaclemys terrapin pileata TaxID=2991368 RepID=UPI0023A8D8A1|nr:tRNA N6-adenosine threonylcarbamoyltransferase, mitochondrial isoform X1 [Malaclemys terrapin pileata]XP_053899682.1 tRNA N6-adenosine threonylcarbamoyltransferase, mitochondrial isoform X1 [Malaclemys terrapin pileata]XP_053899683.1 tRNA N6-adenosine threonylcarbamoyltransferase, mitochondrial isoform X1 [Malaclemys terrapin pileata]XP_053899684.1 tRNA N6-adenosine threonylcarbamoyltransferase, mitochondrial isoform X1 [Malaclemys terrapin pileata]XP_053899685.1 tRNA N6-adenosine threonylca